jgi:hypothetical protein
VTTFRLTCLAWLTIAVSSGVLAEPFPEGEAVSRDVSEGSQLDVESKTEAPAAQPREQMTIPSAGSSDRGAPGLDALLKLPSGYNNQPLPQSVAGASEKEWRRRFRVTRSALDEARETLEATKRELDGVAFESGGSQWSVAPPGGGGGGAPSQSTSPLSFKLRQALKASRIELEAAERSLRELEIEANLAGVPVAWRGTSAEAGSTPPEVGQLLD